MSESFVTEAMRAVQASWPKDTSTGPELSEPGHKGLHTTVQRLKRTTNCCGACVHRDLQKAAFADGSVLTFAELEQVGAGTLHVDD